MSLTPPARAGAQPPDLTGVWQVRFKPFDYHEGEAPQLLPWAEEKRRENAAALSDPTTPADPTTRCLPPGVPRVMNSPVPFHLVQHREIIVIAHEFMSTRLIYMDIPHHEDAYPTFSGNSVGRWEGDTLIVDTTQLRGDTSWIGADGTPHSDQLHVIERYRLLEDGTLDLDITVDDPGAFEAPWRIHLIADRRPDTRVVEEICENTRLVP